MAGAGRAAWRSVAWRGKVQACAGPSRSCRNLTAVLRQCPFPSHLTITSRVVQTGAWPPPPPLSLKIFPELTAVNSLNDVVQTLSRRLQLNFLCGWRGHRQELLLLEPVWLPSRPPRFRRRTRMTPAALHSESTRLKDHYFVV